MGGLIKRVRLTLLQEINSDWISSLQRNFVLFLFVYKSVSAFLHSSSYFVTISFPSKGTAAVKRMF